MNCPHCSKKTYAGGKRCVHCNRLIRKLPSRHASEPINCPVCKVKTDIIYLAGIELDHCDKCNGTWFDKGEVEQLTESLSDPAVCREMIEVVQNLYGNRKASTRGTYINCSVCSEPMLHKVYADFSGIMLDSCGLHGIWLEKPGLEKMLELFETGEIHDHIQRSKRFKVDEIKQRVQSLENKQEVLESDQARTDRFTKVHFILDWLFF